MRSSPSSTDVIDLSGAHAAPPPEAAELIRRSWSAAVASSSDLTRAAPPLGLWELRQALADLCGSDPDHLAVTSGVRSAVPLLGERLRRCVVERPGFEGVPAVLRSLGYEVERQSWSELSGTGAALWITHPCRNPDGASLPPALLARILEDDWSTVVVNETYRWYGGAYQQLPASNWFAVGSLNKLTGTGTRLGWLRGPGVEPDALHGLRAVSPPAVVQLAWLRFLERGGVELMRPALDGAGAALAALSSALDDEPSLGSASERPGPNLLVHLPPGVQEAEAVVSLRRLGLAVGAGADFAVDRPAVRLCLAGIEVAAAAEAGRRLADWLRNRSDRKPRTTSTEDP